MGRILLIGMMGAGKTSVGQALSRRTGWPYSDNDELVATLTGTPTVTLLELQGEPALREAESLALGRALSADPPLIAGIAAGVVMDERDRARLRRDDAFVVYLHTPLDVLVDRVGTGTGRPWLQPDPETALRRLIQGREPLFRDVADLVVDTSTGDAESQADLVLEALGR